MDTGTATTASITVDFNKSLRDMIDAGKYDWVHPQITADHFPVEGKGVVLFEPKLFHFCRNISSEKAVATMTKENFTPASHVHGTAYGATFPEEQRQYPIVCLGSSAQVYGYRNVVCLIRCGGRRYLDLFDWRGGWDVRWRFLGVRTLPSAP